MSGNKIKLSEILRDRKQSDSSFTTQHKKTDMTLEDLEKRLAKISQSETKQPPQQKLSEPLSDKRLDSILNKLSKIKQSTKQPSAPRKPMPEELENLNYEFLPGGLKVPRSVKKFLSKFEPSVVGNVGRLFTMYDTVATDHI